MNDMKYLGIDLGTSALKLLLLSQDGSRQRTKCAYETTDPAGWLAALKAAITQLKQQDSLDDLAGISFSSQVGTYILDSGESISWQASCGAEELRQIKTAVSQEEFLEAIGMDHPELISYPLPRLLYIKKHFPKANAVCMPKELLIKALTGNLVSDFFSWRGLCHPGKEAYSQALLDRFGITLSLPTLAKPTDQAGVVTEEAAAVYGLPAGTPVYVGCNDFFAGLLGMGVWETDSIFELSGTSEHLGIITETPLKGAFVSGAYFNGCATYGGTKSSGVSCDFAIENFGIDDLAVGILENDPPIFLPYLNGERAPVYDPDARGVFFGIRPETTRREMAYAVLEGVVFSLYHIGSQMPLKPDVPMITGGGSSGNRLMAELKAALFDRPVLRAAENDASAMGAAMLAMTGAGLFSSLADATAMVAYEPVAQPNKALHTRLQKRFAVYANLYSALKPSFQELKEI